MWSVVKAQFGWRAGHRGLGRGCGVGAGVPLSSLGAEHVIQEGGQLGTRVPGQQDGAHLTSWSLQARPGPVGHPCLQPLLLPRFGPCPSFLGFEVRSRVWGWNTCWASGSSSCGTQTHPRSTRPPSRSPRARSTCAGSGCGGWRSVEGGPASRAGDVGEGSRQAVIL